MFIVILENLQDMRAMTDAAGDRPVILVNPRLKVLSKNISHFLSLLSCLIWRDLIYTLCLFLEILDVVVQKYKIKYQKILIVETGSTAWQETLFLTLSVPK